MSHPYPCEQYTPSPTTSTPLEGFSQWETLPVQDVPSPQQQPEAPPTSAATPIVIQIPERRRRRVFYPPPKDPLFNKHNLIPLPSSSSAKPKMRSDASSSGANSPQQQDVNPNSVHEQSHSNHPQAQGQSRGNQAQSGPVRRRVVNRTARLAASQPYQYPASCASLSPAVGPGEASTATSQVSEHEGLQLLYKPGEFPHRSSRPGLIAPAGRIPISKYTPSPALNLYARCA